jgi:FlaA1/EpsC-like NDP-sugar epimerase
MDEKREQTARPEPVEGRGFDRLSLSAGGSTDDIFAGQHLPALLGRPLCRIPTEDGRRQLARSRILVTGAAGSVGTALVSRLLDLDPELIVAVDTHEASLFRLLRSLPTGAPVDLRVADVRNETKMRRMFADVQPAVAFHLAAYKHVPFGEREADEPVTVNVLGTDVVARAAAAANTAQLVYPSSDKAVNPPSIYGATKRLAETVLLAHAASHRTPAVHVVRYVNILGSSGSVLETFAQQARAGSALTLTDPRMTRYWMAMDEGVDILIHSLSLASGSLTVLDTGEPTPVKAMAERLFGILGEGTRPTFTVTGARPGERLAEELVSESEEVSTLGNGVLCIQRLRPAKGPPAGALVAELKALVEAGDPEALRERVMQLARELQ